MHFGDGLIEEQFFEVANRLAYWQDIQMALLIIKAKEKIL